MDEKLKEHSISIITDSEGRGVGRMAWFVDITERKHIEEALKESSEKLKLRPLIW
ncbi:MAG: hypothetical protein JJE15_06580 [Desulfobacteraceae bacterium]|nr:hypothetical protein [Desulfobacteraceae bacterium]